MGWSASWAAVQGSTKAEVLAVLGLEETEQEVFPGSREGEFSCHELADGWFVVFCEHFDGLDREQVLELSKLGLAVGRQFEDKVEMTSVAMAARDGVELWRIFHNTVKSSYRLDVTGEPPEVFAAFRDEAFRLQKEDGGADFVFDVPAQVAASVCGYDAEAFEPAFQALRSVASQRHRAGRPSDRASGGLFSWLFGKRSSR